MSVYVETSAGDLVVDLFTDECPLACNNFVKLCKAKYYNNCLFFKISRNFIAQTGDPQNSGNGGSSVYGLIDGPSRRCFKGEILPELKHLSAGMLGMSSAKDNACASQFYITLAGNLDSLDGKHTLFGEVAEDEDGVVARLNAAIVDDDDRPLQNIRIRRTTVLDDPFPDPEGLAAVLPERSPEPVYEFGDRLEEDWKPEEDTRDEEELEAEVETQKAKNRKILLEMIGDRPDADAKAPDEFLFVCKLNPITNEEDLETIFSRFGDVIACDIIRDKKTGDSLNYAFIGFSEKKSAEEAYLKMNNALIDDRRIKVDFSQSMYHQWKEYRRFNVNPQQRPGQQSSGKGGQGMLLSGGRLQLKTSAHGQGVGNLGLMGQGHGHGMDRSGQHAQHADRRDAEEHMPHSEREIRDNGRNGGGTVHHHREGDAKHYGAGRGREQDERRRHEKREKREKGDKRSRDRDRSDRNEKDRRGDHSGKEGRSGRRRSHDSHKKHKSRHDKRESKESDRGQRLDKREEHRVGREDRGYDHDDKRGDFIR